MMSIIGDAIFEILATEGPMTRGQLKTKTGIPRTTLFDNMIMDERFTNSPKKDGKRGRDLVYWEVNK